MSLKLYSPVRKAYIYHVMVLWYYGTVKIKFTKSGEVIFYKALKFLHMSSSVVGANT